MQHNEHCVIPDVIPNVKVSVFHDGISMFCACTQVFVIVALQYGTSLAKSKSSSRCVYLVLGLVTYADFVIIGFCLCLNALTILCYYKSILMLWPWFYVTDNQWIIPIGKALL